MIVFFLISVWYFSQAEAYLRCPNRCSGHGRCNSDNLCFCTTGYTGPDCSLKTCPQDRSWADKAIHVDSAHSLSECSNQGLCNRANGKCECFEGYEGLACQRTSCGTSRCSGRGDCLTMHEMVQRYTASRPIISGYLSAWEGNHTTACVCHMGYSGPNCEHKLCPKGDDPVTPKTGHPTVELSLTSVHGFDDLDGFFRLAYSGETFRFPARATLWNETDCEAAFESLKNIAKVRCVLTTALVTERVFSVTVLRLPSYPHENNLFHTDGQWTKESVTEAFHCDTSQVRGADQLDLSCGVALVPTNATLPEYTYCSNRGRCDFRTGTCACLIDFTDAHCGAYSVGYSKYLQMLPADLLEIQGENRDYAQNVLHLQSYVPGLSKFRSFAATDSDSTLFEMDGYGNVNINFGGLTIMGKDGTGGQTIGGGGLSVQGGATVNNHGFQSGGVSSVFDGVRITAGGADIGGGLTVSNIGLSLQGGFTVESRGMVAAGGLTAFGGGATISLGGLSVTGGFTVNSGGIGIFKRGVTVYSDGLRIAGGALVMNGVNSGLIMPAGVTVPAGGLSVAGGVTIRTIGVSIPSGSSHVEGGGIVLSDGQAEIMNNGLQITGGLTVSSPGLFLATDSSGLKVDTGGVRVVDGVAVTGGLSVHSGGIMVTGGLTFEDSGFLSTSGSVGVDGDVYVAAGTVGIRSGGLAVTGGLTLFLSSMLVTGGVSVRSSGIHIAEGLTVATNGLAATGGLTVSSNGLIALGGITVRAGGISTGAGGFSVYSGGLAVTGGVTASSEGLVVSGGMTVASGGVVATSGLSLHNGGLSVTGGISAVVGGVRVTGGLSVLSGGLVVELGGISVQSSGGLVVTGGLTVASDGLMLTSDGMTINAGGVEVTGGITIATNGVSATGGVTVQSDGVSVTGGLSVSSGGIQADGTVTVNTADGSLVGITVRSDGLMLTSGLTVDTGGMWVTGGMTVEAGGVSLPAGGGAVRSGGLFADTLVVHSEGMRITGGGTVNSGGVVAQEMSVKFGGGSIAGGLTIHSGIVAVTGGVSVTSDGLWVAADGVQLKGAFGLSVTGGISVLVDGFEVVVGGLTVRSHGLLTEAGGLSVASGGLRTAGGLTVLDVGLTTTGGLSIQGGGMAVVTGGLDVRDTGMLITGGTAIASGGVLSAERLSILSTGAFINGALPSEVVDGIRIVNSQGLTVASDGLVVADNFTSYNDNRFEQAHTVFSDTRLKTNITRLMEPLEKVAALRGVYYSWRNDAPTTMDSADGDQGPVQPLPRHVGFIAQEVRAVLPEATVETDHPMRDNDSGENEKGSVLGVRYDQLVPLLVEAVQALDRRTADYSSIPSLSVAPYQQSTSEQLEQCPCRDEVLAEIGTLSAALVRLRQKERALTVLVELAERIPYRLHQKKVYRQ